MLLALGLLALRPIEATAAGVAQAPATESRWTNDDIFRRAFWRHPTTADRILHAERREPTAATSDEPQTWHWFLAVRPSPELLARLRDPATFGLAPTTLAAVRPWPAEPATPEWFPDSALKSLADFEILQAPAGHLTLLYRERDNLLFATDSGGGFASAAKPLDAPANPPAP